MFVVTKTLGVKAKSKVNAYNLKLQPCTILSLVCCTFCENHFNQAAFFFPPESIFEKKETEILWSWCWGRRREPRSVCLSICLSVCLSGYLSFGLSLYLSICLSAGWSAGRSVCISVCLVFYIEQKVIYEASAFFSLLFVCSVFFCKLKQIFWQFALPVLSFH